MMSTDVNVYVYSTSNLLFLAGSASQLRLIPEHGDDRMEQRGDFGCWVHNENVSVCFRLRMSPNAPQQPVIALYS